MRRAARIDDNQPQIIAALRKVGAQVQPMHAVGGGFPDLAVGFQGKTFLIEVKDGSKPQWARGLTDAQLRWHAIWPGHVAIAENETDALRIIGAIS